MRLKPQQKTALNTWIQLKDIIPSPDTKMWSKLKKRCCVRSLFTLSFDTTLKHISIYSTDDSLKYLTPRIKEKLLKSLSISNSFWSHSNHKLILESLLHSKLEIIDLTSANIDDDILKILRVCQVLRKIYLIRDGNYNISKQELLNFLKCQRQLQTLQLRNCDIVDDSVLDCISVNCQNISALDIKGCKEITDEGLKYLHSLSCLQSVTLSRTQITNNGLVEFIKGPSGRTLKELIMDNCVHINIKGLQEVPKYCPNLEIFVFYNCDCSEDMAMLYQSNLKNLKQLTWTVSW